MRPAPRFCGPALRLHKSACALPANYGYDQFPPRKILLPHDALGRKFLGLCYGAGPATSMAVAGPIFGFSEGWQLIVNTGTTIVTFLMVFLIQRF